MMQIYPSNTIRFNQTIILSPFVSLIQKIGLSISLHPKATA
jgi:hypothetical protein